MKRASPKKKLLIVSAGVVVILALLAGLVFFGPASQITPDQADHAQQDFTRDFGAKITAVLGYQIVRSDLSGPSSTQDEMGNTDYGLGATYLVRKGTSGSTPETIRADIETFKNHLPASDYSVWVENARHKDGQPLMLCVTAGRYLDNSGDYIPQGEIANTARYIEQSEFDGGYVSPCDTL